VSTCEFQSRDTLIVSRLVQLQIGEYLDAVESLPTVIAEDFEKDDDTNFHVDFLHALTNLRARNYKLDEYEWLQVRLLSLALSLSLYIYIYMLCTTHYLYLLESRLFATLSSVTIAYIATNTEFIFPL
jgi:hypothetical protein